MRFHTAEVRWFSAGPLPESATRWLEGLGAPLGAPEERVDDYWVLGRDDLGIKLRQGRFEVKGRVAEQGERDFPPRARGDVEEWVKWSLGPGEAPAAAAPSIAVHKRRWQRRWGPGDPPVPVGLFEPWPLSCALELAEVRAGGHVAWSVGLEALPGDAPGIRLLVAVGRRALASFPLPLDGDASRSYPAWLRSLG